MEKNPQEEIMLDPTWSILEDGLGYRVLLTGGVPGIDKDGREIVNLSIKPDAIVKKRYNWRFGIEVDNQGNVKLIVLKDDLVPLNLYDDANRKWMYVKSFSHDETNISKWQEHIRKELEVEKRKGLLQDAVIIRLSELLEIAKTNPAKFLKDGMEVYQESLKGLADIINKKKED